MPTKKRKLLIANHRWWYPTTVSGADIANHEFARRLKRDGWSVRVFGIVAPGTQERTRQRGYIADGIKVNLVQSDFIKRLSQVIEKFKPDVVMTSCPETSCSNDDVRRMMNTFKNYNLPTVLYVHDLTPVDNMFDEAIDNMAAIITNSNFMASKIKAKWNLDAHVIYPVPASNIFKVSDRPGRFITFFNPLVHKGLDIVTSLVNNKLKERPFLYVEGFTNTDAHGMELSRFENVVHARQSPDVAAVYMMTRTLIVPSQWEEPFGRVALEAMYNKIPVIASNTGGLAESVGDGGVLIDDFTNESAWFDAIKELDDPKFRQKIIKAGSSHIKKFSVAKQIEKFNDVFNKIL